MEGEKDSLKSQFEGKGSAPAFPKAKGASLDSKNPIVKKKDASQYADVAKDSKTQSPQDSE